MTEAVTMVKYKQNEIAIDEFGTQPEFKTTSDFKAIIPQKEKSPIIERCKEEKNFHSRFKKMLIKIASSYTEIPFYILEIMGDEYGIPNSELKSLTHKFLKEGFLVYTENHSLKIIYPHFF